MYPAVKLKTQKLFLGCMVLILPNDSLDKVYTGHCF